jgi:hypothetical protein
MATFEHIVNVLTDSKMPKDFKDALIKEEELTEEDLIDIANYVNIERNFYTRRCMRLEEKIQDYLNKD